MSSLINAIVDFVTDFISSVFEFIVDVVEFVWTEIVAPLVEEFFNLLGFEDQTVVTGFIVVNRLFNQEWVKPYRQAVISHLQNGTSMSDEIKNIYLTGAHVRIRAYVNYGRRRYYYGLPESEFVFLPSREDAVKTIIEEEVGEEITILDIELGGSTINHFCKQWLQENESTSGYVFIAGFDQIMLQTGEVYEIMDFSLDNITNKYDIELENITENGIQIECATNNLVEIPEESITSTYIYIPLVSGFQIISNSIGNLTLNSIIPAKPLGRFYEVQYRLNSSTRFEDIIYWSYKLIDGDTEHPELYVSTDINVADNVEILTPIAPLILIEQYQNENTNPPEIAITTKKLLNKMDLSMDDLINGLKEAEVGENNTIRDAFVIYGINIAIQDNQIILDYLYKYFLAVFGSVEDRYDELIEWRRLQNIANEPDTIFLPGGDGGHTISNVAGKNALLDRFFPDWRSRITHDSRTRGRPTRSTYVERLRAKIQTEISAITVKIIVKQGRYNFNFGFGAIRRKMINGVIGEINEYKRIVSELSENKESQEYNYSIQKQINETQYEELSIIEMIGFTVLEGTNNTVTLSRLDFVGSDNDGENVKNNFLIPLSYGLLRDRGIIDQKQLVWETAHLVLNMENITELRYYETPKFANFFGSVLRIFSVIYFFFSLGDLKGAEFLWTLATNIAAGLAVEWVVTQIILNNPDNQLAIFLGIVLAFVVGFYIGDIETAVDKALLAINATSTVSTIYVDTKLDFLQEDQIEFLRTSMEQQQELEDRFENAAFSPEITDFIKRTVVHRVEPPEDFFNRTLKVGVRDEMLDLAARLDIERLFSQTIVLESNYEN